MLVTGQSYQDPKDALNEFVSNAADEYVQAGRRGERIRVVLRRKGRYPVVAVDDDGLGMSPERLREVAQNLFKSNKVDDARTLGEKAIGLLAFQQLGGRCEIVTRAEGAAETWMLRLVRGGATAELSRERRRARSAAGTTVYISDLDPDVLRTITHRNVVEYLRRRRGTALERGDYAIEVQEGRLVEVVTPEAPEGVKLPIPPQRTLWGTIEFGLYVGRADGGSRRVAVEGRAGTTILESITELEEFADEPWAGGQVSGRVICPGLQQTAGRRAVLRDREVFPVFAAAVRAVEPQVRRAIIRVNAEIDRLTTDRLSHTLRRIFGAVLRELSDLENPMRSEVGSGEGEGGLFAPEVDQRVERRARAEAPSLEELAPPAGASAVLVPREAAPERSRSAHLPSVAPDPAPSDRRSRFDPDAGVVYYNDRHADYLLVKEDEGALLDYLATLVAKEYVVYNNPRVAADDLGEELVRMLVRVRKHLRRR